MTDNIQKRNSLSVARCHSLLKASLLTLLMLLGMTGVKAADYVFEYDGGYLYVTNGGAVGYTETFSRSCVWTCVSNTGTLAAATLGTTSHFLYTEVNGTRYWLVGSTTNGQAVTVTTTAPGTAYWRNNGDNLYYYSSNNYYLYYRGSSWRTSRSSSTSWNNRNNNNYYQGYYGDYRSTTTAGTNVAQQITGYTVTTPTITPSAAQTLEYGGNASYTAAATATQTVIPAHTTFDIGGYYGTTYYYYNNQIYTNVADFAVDSSVDPTYTWELSGGGADALNLTSTTGDNTTVNYTGSASGTTATLTVTAAVGTTTRTASVTINVTPVEPTAIAATGTSVYVGGSGTVAYALTPDYAYNRVTAVSGNTGIFTVASPTSTGTVDITPVAAGTATLTLTALKSDGTTGASTSVTVTVHDICATPEISFSQSGSTVQATITSTTPGATIRYTTDGSDPTPTTGHVYSAPFTVTDGTTVKAIAVNEEPWDPSQVASAVCSPISYIVPGADGGTVTLNDLEDHNWTYYSGVDSSVDGGNYNTNYEGKLYSPDPRNVKITYKANGGAVSIDESETEFVYYKTIEKVNGAYNYTVISNPFSKRPNGKGFGGWKIKEGAQYISGYNDEATLPLDAELTLTGLDTNYTPNCTSAEIELEATWVNLNNITYASGNTITYNVTGGNYETNILVLNRNVTGTITTTSPVTIMMVEPDGSSDYRGAYTFSGNIAPNNNGVTKIEFVRWTPDGAINATGRNLTIGRGMTMEGTRRALYGTNNQRAMNQILKVESGNFSTFTSYNANPTSVTRHWVIFGCDYDRAKGDNTKLTFTGNFLTGSNRSLGLNSQEEMARVWSKSGSFMTGVSVSDAAQPNSYYIGVMGTHNNGHRYLEIEGGEWYASIAGGMGENHTSTAPGFTFRMRGGIVRGSVYGAAAFANAGGTRTYVITGGTIRGWVAGGANGTQETQGSLAGASYIYVGGKANIDSNGSTSVINRAVGGNVFGAGCGFNASSTAGQVTLGTNVVVADEAYIERGVYGGGSYGYTTNTSNIYVTGGHVGGKSGGVDGTSYQASITGGVFGGACQNRGGTVNTYMTGGIVEGGVYGGSNSSGTISGSVTMNINGGQVGTDSKTANIHGGGYGNNTAVNGNVDLTLGVQNQATPGVTVYGDVYGGSADGVVNDATSDHTNVTLNAGTIYGSLYGGGLGITNANCNVNGAVTVVVNGGAVKKQASGDNPASIFGCNNAMGSPKSTVTVTVNASDPSVTTVPTVYYKAGDELPAGKSIGDVKTEGVYAINGVYGGGNKAHYNPTTPGQYPTVTINGCETSIKDVYGGGNAAAVPYTSVTVNGGIIGRVFAGGNGESGTPAHVGYRNTDANPTANNYGAGTASATIKGGTIGQVFGGSNANGVIRVGSSISIDKSTASGACSMIIGEVYRGGNEAPGALATISIGCTGDLVAGNDGHAAHPENIGTTLEGIGELYGGSRKADNTGEVNLNITSGIIRRVFGGNNISGTVNGTVTVSVQQDETKGCGWYVGDVFGGGNLATYSGDPVVKILHGTVSGNVYGGGAGNLVDGSMRGVAGTVTGNPKVTIGDDNASHKAIVLGDVYGGGDAADVSGTPVIVVNDCSTQVGNLYGGGNAADVTATSITVNGGSIGDAFGGGHGDKSATNPSKYADVKGDVTFNVNGGTIARVFAGSNSRGTIMGTSNLTINKSTSCEMKIREVYGGGNEADGVASNINIGCTGDLTTQASDPENIGVTLEGIGYVYGGANQANIGTSSTPSDIVVNINSGIVGNVFGGNNTSGDIYGTITVNIEKDDAATCASNWYVGNVFGGGNLAQYTGSPAVNIKNGTVSLNVYGGGNEAGVGGTAVSVTGGSVLEGIYGGCNTSGTVSGDVSVSITGGTIGSTTKKANVHGGGYGSATATDGNVDVTINGAAVNIYGDVYGGSALGNVNSDTNDYTHVLLTAGTIYGDAYGGGLGDDTHAALVNGNVTVTQNGVAFVKGTTTDDDGNTVVTAGRIFGCNNLNGSPQGTVLVLVNKTARADGGAHQKSVHDANGNITTDNYEMQAVYGGGNLAAYAPATATLTATGQFTEYLDKDNNTIAHSAAGNPLQVVVNGCDDVSVGYIYGGGNAAPTPSTDVVMLGAYEVGFLFGGGNGKDKYTRDGGTTWNDNPGADVGINGGTLYGNGNANTTVLGGTIHEVYGASNQKGNIKGSINLRVQEDVVACPMVVDKIVGAGKNADIDQDVNMVMGCMPTTKTAYVFGGADNANVNGHVDLTITSGTFGQVFGGNNLSGMIKGYIKVNIEETGCNPIVIDSLYLGGNQAAYSVFGYNDNGTCKTEGTVAYEQPVLNVISCTRIGAVFGGGLGVGAAMYANPTVNINMTKGDYYNRITIDAANNNADQLGEIGNVYGGGNQAAVYGNTTVNIGTEIGNNVTLKSTGDTKQVLGAYITGTVYGAGKGTTADPASAIVAGNTQVNMAGGRVCRSIYGGGELGSVGTFTQFYDADQTYPYHKAGEPKACKPGTGLAEVIITGGTVGLNNQLMPDPSRPTSDDDYGYVFCASKGEADSVTYVNANKLAVVNTTHLKITGGLVIASVYGGSENGQVLDSTLVEISGGQIGTGHYKEGGVDKWDGLYDEADWTTAINKIKDGSFTDADAASFHECDAWPFGDEDHRFVYDYYAGTPGYDSQTGASPGSNGHSFFGNVFGGGSGYYPFAAGKWRATAGRVNGNTRVVITGGHVLTNVYGGNEITDVVGKSTVEMSGGTVGVPRSHAAIAAHPVNSYIFGAGMGDPRVMFNGKGNVGSAEVIVSDNAFVFGSVFGGGEDGHVLGDAKTTIKGNAHIGTFGDSSVDGNIFGSGRGFSAIALTAGVVCGNVTVNIQDQVKILGSVFGGGRLAAVGTYLAEETDTDHYGIMQTGDAHGNVTINITGGTIGNKDRISTSDYSIGDVFGGSKGTLMNDWAKSQKLGLVKNTTVNISQATGSTTTIYGNVYGGGELASVGSYSYATQTQANTFNTSHPNEPMAEGDVNGLLEDGTGLATILITGGTIGQATPSDSKGHVFGGCLGRAGKGYSGYSFVNNSDVTLQGGTVYGSIFGGGENGHVMHDTDVKIKSGTVGIPLDKASLPDASLKDSIVYKGNVYGGGRGIDTYNNNGTNTYSITAGKVAGNTNVTVEGGTVYRNVYGGGSLASVGIRDEDTTTDGLATVTIKGGQIGTDGGASANNYNTLIPDRENRRENGFVFGSGRGMSAGANSSSNLVDLAYTKNTEVYIQGTANVTGSVFGGGENGHVKKNTEVYVKENCFVGTELVDAEHVIDDNGRGRLIYRGNVYGGGRGIDEGGDNKLSLTAGRVFGNTFVEVSGGKIYHDVFGGGSLASVGNETVDPGTGEVTYGDDSGLTQVYIKGGIIGYSENEDYWGFNCGFVYGGCRGLAAEPSSDIVKMAYVHEAEVYIQPGADIKGSVFGGGANGHVKNDTKVVISGGSIGTALKNAEIGFDDHGVANAPVFRGNVYAGGRGVDMYQKAGDESYSMTAGAVYGNAELIMTGGHVWHNVYGSGAMASVGTVKAKPAGAHVHDEIVNAGGTVVNPDGSEVTYLSGVFTDNTGKVTVTITGGTVGDTTPGHEGRNNGRVYGAGRGVSANRSDLVASMEYVKETFVTIGTDGQKPSDYSGSEPGELNYPYIYGAVFGGGENGHVKNDTHVTMHSGIIGWPLDEGASGQHKTAADGASKNPFRGHIFGGGRGVDPLYHSSTETRSSTAGRVYGHTYVNMTGGLVRRAIYGGGLLASVGVYRLAESDLHIIDMIEDEVDCGDAQINISGGIIGNVMPDGSVITDASTSGFALLAPGDNNGHVFGSSCGMVADNYVQSGVAIDEQYRQMGYSHSTNVNISGGHMFGSVFGSGENGHVWEDARINISGGEIGTETSTLIYCGNVYGSGRGVDHPHAHVSETAGKVRGNTTVYMTGGIVWRDVYGGGSLASVGEADEEAADSKKNVTSDPTTNNPFPYSSGLTRVVIDGSSKVHGSVYGSGRGVASDNTEYKQAAYVKNTLVTIQGNAHVWQNVFGGGNAGHVRKNTDVTIDGSAKVDGNVYGGGAGATISPTAGLVNHDVTVNIKNGLIAGDVYGGGAIANTNVHDVRNDASTNPDQASAYGTCSESTRQHCTTAVNLVGGIILGNAYGGGQGVIPADGATAAEIANSGAMVRGDVTVTLNGTGFMLNKGKDDENNDIATSGRVFGGNNLNGSPQGTVLVHVLQTKGVTKSGDTYTINASKPTLDTDTYEVEAVYGGGNLAAYQPWSSDEQATGQFTAYKRSGADVAHNAVKQPLQVVIEGCDETSINYVYGGGNAAAAPSTDVLVVSCYEIGNVFGGGNGKDRISKNGVWSDNPGANVGYLDDGTTSYGTGEALASVVGGKVHYAFGGSNTKGNIRTSAKVFLDEASDCPLEIGEVYGGGNEAYMEGDSKVELGCIKTLSVLYGGSRNADVDGDIEMTITSGHFNRIFGGNNLGGTISGSIQVNVEETGCNPITIGELYGCGNNAPYETPSGKPDPSVNLRSFTSIGRVFGGGLGTPAVVTGNPTVNINLVVGENASVASTYPGKPLTLPDGTTVDMPAHAAGEIGAIGTVFGGGNAAKVDGNTSVNIGTEQTITYISGDDHTPKTVIGANIVGNVFGGGNAAEVTGNTDVKIGK